MPNEYRNSYELPSMSSLLTALSPFPLNRGIEGAPIAHSSNLIAHSSAFVCGILLHDYVGQYFLQIPCPFLQHVVTLQNINSKQTN